MQDDFGDFLQAPAASNPQLPTSGKSEISKPKSLDSKIMESFDLTGPNQRASFKFQQPTKQMGRRPQHTYTPSSNSANWNSLDLKTSEFMAPVRPTHQNQIHHSQAKQHGPYNQPQTAVQVPVYPHSVPPNVRMFSTPITLPNDMSKNTQNQFMPRVPNGAGFSMSQAASIRLEMGTTPAFQQGNRYINQIPVKATASQKTTGPISNMPMYLQDGTFGGQFSVRSHMQSQLQTHTTMANNNGFAGTMPGYSQGGMAYGQNFDHSQPTLLVQPQTNAGVVFQQSSPNFVEHLTPPTQSMPRCQVASNHQLQPSTHSQQNHSSKKIDLSLPSWMTNPSEIPPLYKQVLKLCATPTSFADTARLYPIFVSSQLPKDVLGHIWSAANQSVPGQLTFSEVYIALALIALAQKGEMNLTVNYVTKLRSPPIPGLQLPSAAASPNMAQSMAMSSTATGGAFPMPQPPMPAPNLLPVSTVMGGDDDFADFQSVTPAMSSHNPTIYGASSVNAPDKDFQDFQSFVPEKTSNTLYAGLEMVSQSAAYPDRSLINSPNTTFTEDMAAPASSSQPKAMLGSIDFNKFKADTSKSLHSAAKSLNIVRQSFSLSPKESKFSDCEMSVAASSDTAAEQDDFGDFKHASPLKFSSQVTDDHEASKTNAAIQSSSFSLFGSPGMVSLPPGSSAPQLQVSSLINTNPSPGDKYSALRDLVPALMDSKTESSEFDDFADFQSPPGAENLTSENSMPQSFQDFGFSNTTDSANRTENPVPASSFLSMIGKSALCKDDSQSVTSLELPSLSHTISNLSIGSSSPYKGSDDLYAVTSPKKIYSTLGGFSEYSAFQSSVPAMPATSQEKTEVPVTNFDDFSSFQSNTAPVSASAFFSTTAQAKSTLDDGLYSLHEPISPPMSKRVMSDEKSEKHISPMSPPKVKRFVVPRRLSEAESDFGDFSSGPPPIDDDMDHHNADFDIQEGDSSLVDFDAFGHFEEAKMESLKKKEAEFKRNKEDATAFSEFVKSSIVNMKPFHESSDASNPDIVDNGVIEEGWSAFNSNETVTTRHFNDVDSPDDRLTVEITVDESEQNGVHDTTWKLEATISDPEFDNIPESERSKWDEEGEELKARMEGTAGSDPMELYADHWGRCLATCKDIIISTGDILAALNSPSVCHEIVNSSRGKEFISCTSEVYGVARRIRKGMESVGLLDDDLDAALKEIEIAWNNLLGFCPYTPSMHKTPEHCCHVPKHDAAEGVRKTSACSLCLLSTDGSTPVGLEYGGKLYHAPCANLWLNQIAPILPRLELPAVF